MDVHAVAHELWSAAQLAPGEGIADGAQRIAALLEPMLTRSTVVSADVVDAKHAGGGFDIEAATEAELVAYDAAAHQMCAAVLAVLDGRDTGAGSNHEPWGTVRRRLVDLVSQDAASIPCPAIDSNSASVEEAERFAFASSNQSAALHRHWFRKGYEMGLEARPCRGLSIAAFNPIWFESAFDDATEEAFARGVALLRQIEAAHRIPAPAEPDPDYEAAN
ncbi:hypothetical protein [Acidovorax sp.]|uniref:hypothetical protein n=1 Tax=Acidovorax sp. TaxID=1872122 RepID=UPI00391F6469